MIDHLRNTQSVGLEDLAVLVLDEADRLLEMGFAEEVHYIWVLQYGAFWACDG
jgi:ATP-dependent RNA helicase DDX27